MSSPPTTTRIRPATPDGWPLLGELTGLPVVVATGHYRNGILLAPWTSERIAELVLTGTSPALAPFSPQRLVPAIGLCHSVASLFKQVAHHLTNDRVIVGH